MPPLSDFIHMRVQPESARPWIGGVAALIALLMGLAGLLLLAGWVPPGGPAAGERIELGHSGALALLLGAGAVYLQCVRAGSHAAVCKLVRVMAFALVLLGLWETGRSGAAGLAFCLLGSLLLLHATGARAPAAPARAPEPEPEAGPGTPPAPAAAPGLDATHLRKMVAQLEALRETDKREIARQLHDEVGALLTSLNMHLEGVYPALPPDGQGAERKLKIQALLQSLVRITRRMQSNLHPAMLALFGLHAALHELVDDFGEQSGIACSTSLPDEEASLDRTLQITVYRIVQDYLNSVVRHAQASSMELIFDVDEDQVGIVIRDDGQRDLGERERHATTLALCDRVMFLGGTVRLAHSAQGVNLAVSIPLPRQELPALQERQDGQDTGSR